MRTEIESAQTIITLHKKREIELDFYIETTKIEEQQQKIRCQSSFLPTCKGNSSTEPNIIYAAYFLIFFL